MLALWGIAVVALSAGGDRLAATPALSATQPDEDRSTLACWPKSERARRREFEQKLIEAPSADKLREWHDLLAVEPHVAGTPGDLREVGRLADAFRNMGLEVQEHEFWAYLCRPLSAVLQVVTPTAVDLVVKEDILKEDPLTANPELMPGWNAYSGSGDVTAEVVYANFGTKADFKKLADLGVDIKGKIVLARYGGNFRGYKAKFAQEAGAVGLIIYTDPADSGYCKGLMYPEGGFSSPTCIQRGSILTLDYVGDPLTPFVEATKDAERLDPDDLALPKIPVQPVGWGSAQQIIGRMKGTAVPQGWQGGLPFPYRLTGGPELTVRLKIEQERSITKSYNVIAKLKGNRWPDEMMIVGCHHDAWGFGAADPLAGTIVLMEAARCMSDAAKAGQGPARTIVFAAWGAEEYGIIGSTEWVEANRDDLVKNAVGYINLDMASMGVEFGSAATPSMQRVVADVARVVPQARGKEGETVFDGWAARSKDGPFTHGVRFGDLGGGSDHEPFVCHVGVAAAGFGSGGSQGNSYHSTYDNLNWYRQVVGDDYAPAVMITRMTMLTASRLADAPLLPLDFVGYGKETQRHLRDLAKRSRELVEETSVARMVDDTDRRDAMQAPASDLPLDRTARASVRSPFEQAMKPLNDRATAYGVLAGGASEHLRTLMGSDVLSDADLVGINQRILGMDRAWLSDVGVPGRPWFRNLFVASDEDSGYASWMLPCLRHAVEHQDSSEFEPRVQTYLDIFGRLVQTVSELKAIGTGER
ncbi:MAG: M28 family peptidase [Pyrinomonadaceae bacterium]|nr:M28 family peptidase [Phycisphaerales bacterium]